MNKTVSTILKTVLFLGFGGFLFYRALSGEDLSEIWQNIKGANKGWILLSMICGLLSHAIRALRWNLLLQPLGYKATFAGSFHAVIIGYLVNIGLPRVGEVARPAVLNKLEHIPFNKLVGTVVVERVVDLIVTLVLTIAIFFIQFNLISDYFDSQFSSLDTSTSLIYVIFGIFFVVILFVIYKKREWFYKLPLIHQFRSFIEGLFDGVKTIRRLERNGLFIAYSLLIWLMYFCMPYFILFALDGTSHLGLSAGLTVLLFGTAAMIVPVPGGIGPFEYFVPVALNLYGIGSTVAKSFTLITHSIQFIVILGVGIFSCIYFGYKLWRKHELEKKN